MKSAAAPCRFQAGADTNGSAASFSEQEALEKFRRSEDVKVRVDGVATRLDTVDIEHPAVGFVSGRKGLMGELRPEG